MIPCCVSSPYGLQQDKWQTCVTSLTRISLSNAAESLQFLGQVYGLAAPSAYVEYVHVCVRNESETCLWQRIECNGRLI